MRTLKDFDFAKTIYDRDKLIGAEDENPFMHLGVEFFKDLCKLASILGSTYKIDSNNNPRLWTRNEAILGGLMIRCSKLMVGYLDNICQKRMDIANIIQRPLVETLVNLKYLLTFSMPELFDEFVNYSLRSEKKFLEEIEANISERGHEIPIETRMKKSIFDSFQKSGVSPEEIDTSCHSVWGGSIYKRFEKLGLEKTYIGIFGLRSHSVHGNWQEIMMKHLEYQGGLFAPKTSWGRPRPQALLSLGVMIGGTILQYLDDFIHECLEKQKLQVFLRDLLQRIEEVDALHEGYCIKNMQEKMS